MVAMVNPIEFFTWLGYISAASVVVFIAEKFLHWAFDKKVITPFIQRVRWKWRAFLTRRDPLECTFEIKYSPMSSLTVSEAKQSVSDVFDNTGSESQGRIEFSTLSWDGDGEGIGFIQAEHIECDYPFDIQVELIENPEDLTERPSVPFEKRLVDAFHFSIGFKFPYHRLEATIQNLGVFASFLESGLSNTVRGTLSPGQFVIHPVESNLTLDEWIVREGFDVSLMLADKGDTAKTEVEFFPDRAEVHPPHLEMDTETTRYIRLMILEYYLKKS